MIAKPKFCPWCGADVEEWGHDDNCKRPERAELVVNGADSFVAPGGATGEGS